MFEKKYKLIKEFIGDENDFSKITRKVYPQMFQKHIFVKDLEWSDINKIYQYLVDVYIKKYPHYKVYIVNENEELDLCENLMSDEKLCEILNN